MNRTASIKRNDYKWELDIALTFKLMAEQLNNEGSIGNYTQSRTIVDEEGNKRNMISGPSTKHGIRDRLIEVTDKSKLCSTCRIFSPLKNGKHDSDDAGLSASGNRTKGCPVCDIMGFMNPSDGEKRGSVIRVSDAIAEVTGTRNVQLHSRLDTVESSMTSVEKGEEKVSTNMIFHEENRFSTYHQVVQIDLARIAFDDENQQYVTFDREFIKSRIRDAVTAVVKHYLDIEGAQTASHKPLLVSLKGSVMEKTDGSQIATNYGTMNEDYLDVQKALNSNTFAIDNPLAFKTVMDEFLDEEYLDFMVERNLQYVEQTFHQK